MFPHYYLASCLSTNDAIENFLSSPSRSLSVYTFNQTSGRGQYGNSWDTQVDQNLAFSLALPSKLISLSETLLNYHTAETFRQFLAKLTQSEALIKWPNDLILHKKKVGGILIEKRRINKEGYFILGVGINVRQRNFTALPSAGSLWTQSGQEFDLHETAQLLNEYLFHHLLNFPCEEAILESYNAHLFKKDEVGVFEIEGLRQNGIIKSANSQGELIVDLENEGEKRFYHKEIKMLY